MTGTLLKMPEDRSYDELPKRQRDFVHRYVMCGDAEEAYLGAGYKQGPNQKAKAAQMKSRLRQQIALHAREVSESVDMAIVGMKTVRHLAINAESEAVRLKAGMALMERGLPEKPQEVHHHHEHSLRALPDHELEDRMNRLLQRLSDERGVMIDVEPESRSIS